MAKRALYRWRFTNWLLAEPWRFYPLFEYGWHYERIWESLGRWQTVRQHPLRRLWWTITFPHVHTVEEEEGDG